MFKLSHLYLKKVRKYLILFVVCSFFVSILSVIIPYLNANFLNLLVDKKYQIGMIIFACAIGTYLIKNILFNISFYNLKKMNNEIDIVINKNGTEKNENTVKYSNLYSHLILKLFKFIEALAVNVIIFIINYKIGLVSLLSSLIILLISFYERKLNNKQTKDFKEKIRPKQAEVLASEYDEKVVREYNDMMLSMEKEHSIFSSIRDVIVTVFEACVILLSCYLLLKGELSLEAFFMIYMYRKMSNYLFTIIFDLINDYKELNKISNSICK